MRVRKRRFGRLLVVMRMMRMMMMGRMMKLLLLMMVVADVLGGPRVGKRRGDDRRLRLEALYSSAHRRALMRDRRLARGCCEKVELFELTKVEVDGRQRRFAAETNLILDPDDFRALVEQRKAYESRE